MSNKNQDVELFLDLVNKQPEYRKMLAKFPTQEFISLQCWPSLYENLRQQLFIWMLRPCFISLKLLVKYDNSFQLSMGKIHYLYSSELFVGYLIELPKSCRVELTPTYISSLYGKQSGSISDIEDLPSLEHLLNGQHLSAFYLGNSQVIASINKQLADFIR
jgi:hypothetical protein